ncbi:MAG: acetolactate synthase-1/2/3 large subunit [Candidatus Azotimanducaceae bacterium]|jgi:acetolactate synthase-1/2/3 large subunit
MSTCGETLVKLLENYSVDTVFGIPGVHTVELYRGLPNTNIRHITPRHEQGAGFMADGYARVTGKPGVCLIITGPGMTNIATAMAQALADSIPMLVISSVNNTHELGLGEGRLHELPNQKMTMSGVSVFSHTLLRADELPQILARAFTVFESERPGPVHIEIPINVITSNADHLDLAPYPIARPPAPDPLSITQACDLLMKATQPLIAIGGGAIAASEAVIALAISLDAPVVNTVNAKGVMPYSHSLAVGGSGSHAAIRNALEKADVVLAVGTEFGETDYDFFFNGPVRINGKLIRIDIDAHQLTRNIKADLPIVSDAALALTAIADGLRLMKEQKQIKPKPTASGSTRASELRTILLDGQDPNYKSFFDAIREALPEVIIAGDSTQTTYYAWLNYETEHPRRYFHSASGYGTLGYAIPAAIGASIGRPNLPVIGLIGDGAAQFTIGELASAVEANVGVIFLLWNNSGYGEIKRFMTDRKITPIGVDIHTPDFSAVAKAMGCHVASPTNIAELKTCLITANKLSQPTLIELNQSDFAPGYPEL